MLDASRIIDVVFLLFSIISTVTYIIILLVLIHKRKEAPFNSYYFKLFTSLGAADLCAGLNSYIEISKQWGYNWERLFRHENFGFLFIRMPGSLYIIFGMSQYYGVLALTANRFYTIEAPLWTSSKHSMALFLQWFLPFLQLLPYISSDFVLVRSNTSTGEITVPTLKSQKDMMLNGLLITLTQASVVVSVAVLYVRIYFRVKSVKNNFGLTEDSQSELKLLFVGFTLFIIMLAQQITTVTVIVVLSVGKDEHLSLVHNLLYHLSNVFAFINPYLLWAFSPPARDAVLINLRLKKHNVVHVQPIAHDNQEL